ncbi:MAG: hypothetical protein MHMPM18_000308 [Marteilia pararefringens]
MYCLSSRNIEDPTTDSALDDFYEEHFEVIKAPQKRRFSTRRNLSSFPVCVLKMHLGLIIILSTIFSFYRFFLHLEDLRYRGEDSARRVNFAKLAIVFIVACQLAIILTVLSGVIIEWNQCLFSFIFLYLMLSIIMDIGLLTALGRYETSEGARKFYNLVILAPRHLRSRQHHVLTPETSCLLQGLHIMALALNLTNIVVASSYLAQVRSPKLRTHHDALKLEPNVIDFVRFDSTNRNAPFQSPQYTNCRNGICRNRMLINHNNNVDERKTNVGIQTQVVDN